MLSAGGQAEIRPALQQHRGHVIDEREHAQAVVDVGATTGGSRVCFCTHSNTSRDRCSATSAAAPTSRWICSARRRLHWAQYVLVAVVGVCHADTRRSHKATASASAARSCSQAPLPPLPPLPLLTARVTRAAASLRRRRRTRRCRTSWHCRAGVTSARVSSTYRTRRRRPRRAPPTPRCVRLRLLPVHSHSVRAGAARSRIPHTSTSGTEAAAHALLCHDIAAPLNADAAAGDYRRESLTSLGSLFQADESTVVR
jgi:hypothetical protein